MAMIVSNSCNPDPRVEKEAIALSEAGYKVTIHAFDREEKYEINSNFKNIVIKRYRVGHTPSGAPSLITGAKVLFGLKKFRTLVTKNLMDSPPEFIHCHDADTLAVGLILKSRQKSILIFDMHDLAHTWARMANPFSIIRKIVALTIERRLIRRLKFCDLIITSSGSASKKSHPGLREWIRKRVKNPNIVVIENRPEKVDKLYDLPERFTIGYAGKIREKTMFETLIKAIEKLPDSINPKVIIAGHGTASAEVDKLFQKSRIEVERIGKFQTNQLPEIIQKMSIMYAVYPTSRGNILDGAIPTKMFDAAINGRPSIVNSNCLMGDIAIAEKIGITVNSGEVEELTAALLQIENKNNIIKLQRDWSTEAKRLVSAYGNVLNDSSNGNGVKKYDYKGQS